jgi:transcriptional regulator with XRE-family HTH domain
MEEATEAQPQARTFPPAGIYIDGPKIRELRKERCIELADFARMIGRSRVYLTRIEIGDAKRVSPTTLARIGEALELTTGERRSLIKRPDPEPAAQAVA